MIIPHIWKAMHTQTLTNIQCRSVPAFAIELVQHFYQLWKVICCASFFLVLTSIKYMWYAKSGKSEIFQIRHIQYHCVCASQRPKTFSWQTDALFLWRLFSPQTPNFSTTVGIWLHLSIKYLTNIAIVYPQTYSICSVQNGPFRHTNLIITGKFKTKLRRKISNKVLIFI